MKSRLEKVYSKMPNNKVDLKAQKVALGLVDNFNYEYQYLEDEIGRLSYSVEEWFEEKWQEYMDAYMPLRDVYINNSESFISEADVAGDMDVLNEIEEKANDLGLDVSDVYPDFEDHKRQINYLEDLEKRFDDQKRKIEQF
tara:strand:- start:16 stop:438 length:423 start_codon:yes stop_codon:yes gene_type:complete